MRKVWTEEERKGKQISRRIRWPEKVFKDGVWKWRKRSFDCGTDYPLWQEQLKKIAARIEAEDLGHVDLGRAIQECFDAFLVDKEATGTMPRTLVTYRSYIPPFIKFIQNRDMSHVTVQIVKDYKLSLLVRGLSSNTLLRHLSDLRTFLNWARYNGWMAVNIFGLISEEQKKQSKRRFIPKPSARARFYSDGEIEVFESILDSYPYYFNDGVRGEAHKLTILQLHGIIRLMYQSGLRPEEACLLRAEKIRRFDTGEGEVEVTTHKGGQEFTRTVPIRPRTMMILPIRRVDYLFPDFVKAGEKGMEGDSFKLIRYFNRLRELAKIERAEGEAAPTLYGLRHTFARLCIEGGMHPKTICDIMGHTSYEMFMKVYGHLTKAHLREMLRTVKQPGLRGNLGAIDQVIHPSTGQITTYPDSNAANRNDTNSRVKDSE